MLRLPKFAYVSARTVEEASRLAAGSARAVLVAGGTDLIPNLKRRQSEPNLLVGLSGISELSGIRGDGTNGLSIGGLTTLDEIASSQIVSEHYPALAQAAMGVGSPQIRGAGTLGGNLCQDTRCSFFDAPSGWRDGVGHCLKDGGDSCRVAPGGERCWAVSSSDLAPVVIALEGRVRLECERGRRWLDAESLFRNDGISYLNKRRDEILTRLKLPPPDGVRACYLKLRQRGAIDFPILGAAVSVRLDRGGVCTFARVVVGAVGSCPLRVGGAEDALTGTRLSDGDVNAAAAEASRVAKPMDNASLTLQYRKAMVQVLVTRALKTVLAA